MKCLKKSHLAIALLLLALVTAPCASAHHLWLFASRYDAPRLATARQWGQWKPDTVILFGYGDIYPLHDPVEAARVAALTRYSANGDQQPIPLGQGAFLSSPLTVFVPGAHIIAAELHPRVVSQVGEERQHRYLFVPRDEVTEGVPVVRSFLYHNYAKALFQVGPHTSRAEDATLLARPVGHALEIVLLSNPRELAAKAQKTEAAEGDQLGGLAIAVLFQGQPLADVTLRASHLGLPAHTEGASHLVELDDAGRGKLPTLCAGVWQLHISHRVPAPPELAAKVAALSYSASFTFEVPAAARGTGH